MWGVVVALLCFAFLPVVAFLVLLLGLLFFVVKPSSSSSASRYPCSHTLRPCSSYPLPLVIIPSALRSLFHRQHHHHLPPKTTFSFVTAAPARCHPPLSSSLSSSSSSPSSFIPVISPFLPEAPPTFSLSLIYGRSIDVALPDLLARALEAAWLAWSVGRSVGRSVVQIVECHDIPPVSFECMASLLPNPSLFLIDYDFINYDLIIPRMLHATHIRYYSLTHLLIYSGCNFY